MSLSTGGSLGALLLDVGLVMRYGVLCRPSQIVKSPYVADLRTSPFETSSNPFASFIGSEGMTTGKEKTERKKKIDTIVTELKKGGSELAHAPSLDCAGMLVMGSNCYVTKNSGATTKTAYTIQLCEEERGPKESNALVGYHPALAEKIAKSILQKGLLRDEIGDFENIASQRTFKNSRVDFVIEGKDNTLTLLEVKNVVGAEYEEGSVPDTRSPIGVYEVNEEGLPALGERHAIFPHGSVKPGIGVVSDRAIKHVHELGQLHDSVDEETGRTIKTAVLFIVNRSDTTAFRPCHEACPMFAQCLKQAQTKGTKLIAREVQWVLGDLDGDGEGVSAEARLGKSLPVRFHSSVTADVDEAHLQQVLKYNAEVPKTRSPPAAVRKRVVTPEKETSKKAKMQQM